MVNTKLKILKNKKHLAVAKIISKELIKYKQITGLNDRQLAIMLGLRQSTYIFRYISLYTMPSLPIYCRMCEVFEWDIMTLNRQISDAQRTIDRIKK